MSSLTPRFSTYLVGGLFAQGVMFLTWFTLSWLLTPDEFGLLSLILFAVELLSILSSMGMDAALIRFGSSNKDSANVFSIALKIILGSFSLTVFSAYLLLQMNSSLSNNHAVVWIAENFLLLTVAIAANVCWNIYQSFQIAGRRARPYAVTQVTRSLVNFCLCVCLVLIKPVAGSVIAATAITSILILVVLLNCNISKYNIQKYNSSKLSQKTMFSYGFPLMLYGLFGLATIYTQRLALDQYSNVAILGVFSFFHVITLQFNGLWGSLNKSWTPEFFFLMEGQRSDALAILQGILVIVSVICPLVLAIYVILGEIFLNSLIFSDVYRHQSQVFYILLVSTIFTGLYTVAYPLYYVDHQTKRILLIAVCLYLCNLVLSVLMISRWGAMGAATSVLLMTIITLWGYLLVYRDWADVGYRTATMLVFVTLGCFGSALVLILSSSSLFFACSLIGTSGVAWILGAPMARPILLRVGLLPV